MPTMNPFSMGSIRRELSAALKCEIYKNGGRYKIAASWVSDYRRKKLAIVELMENARSWHSISMISPRAVGVKRVIKVYPLVSYGSQKHEEILEQALEDLRKLNNPLAQVYYELVDEKERARKENKTERKLTNHDRRRIHSNGV